jgi:hypothetical protein
MAYRRERNRALPTRVEALLRAVSGACLSVRIRSAKGNKDGAFSGIETNPDRPALGASAFLGYTTARMNKPVPILAALLGLLFVAVAALWGGLATAVMRGEARRPRRGLTASVSMAGG